MYVDTKILSYAFSLHNSVNHNYDNAPYSVHLHLVVEFANKYLYLIKEEDKVDVISACLLHDTIEDCRVTYNDILEKTNDNVAEIVFSLTNNKGRNRTDRADSNYYHLIRQTKNAVFVKLCDRLANVYYSYYNKGDMLYKYRKENDRFLSSLMPSSDDVIKFNEMII